MLAAALALVRALVLTVVPTLLLGLVLLPAQAQLQPSPLSGASECSFPLPETKAFEQVV